VRELVKTHHYHVRAITRDAESAGSHLVFVESRYSLLCLCLFVACCCASYLA
jgi:hypothetical protein